MQKKTFSTRLLSVLLALCMLASTVSFSAFADDEPAETEADAIVTAEVQDDEADAEPEADADAEDVEAPDAAEEEAPAQAPAEEETQATAQAAAEEDAETAALSEDETNTTPEEETTEDGEDEEAAEEPAETEQPEEEEAPEEVQAFLDAVAAIPAQITAENAAAVAEYLYGEVSDLYEALLGTEYEEREDVQQAVAVMAAAIEAVDAVLEMEAETLEEEPEQTCPFTMEKIEDGVYKITGEGMFAGEFIYNGELSTWNSAALGYMAIKKLILDEGITGIAEETFVDSWVSRSLKEIVLPTTLTTIGPKAFRDGYLQKINLEHVTSIGAEAFSSNGNPGFAATYGNGITELTIPASLTEIGEKAFYQMRGLKTLTIEEGVTSIGANAFEFCSSLETVVLPNSLETIGKEAFSGCNALTTISMTGEAAAAGTAHIANVTSIDVGALNGANMTSLVLENIGTIGNGINSITLSCPSLTNLTVNNVGTVSDYAFYWSPALANVVMNNVGYVGMGAFLYDTALNEVTLTDVKEIGERAFYGYGNTWSTLKKVTINGTSTIGTQAFAYNYYLNDLTLDNIGIVGQQAFYYCASLPAVAIGTVGTINQYAFLSCTGLTSIDSLENVKRIDGFAFYGCSNLKGLTIEDATKMGFNGNYADVMARVEEILKGEFKLDAAPDIIELIPNGGEVWDDTKIAENENWNHYDDQVQLMEQARWTNDDKTEAEVQVTGYYTAEQQMDYIFVADLSASMAQLGNAADENARFYDMQSKLLDMAGQLLGSEGYKCRIAIVTFGGALNATTPGTFRKMEFTNDLAAVKDYINSLEPLYENTDYGLGMQQALKLVKENTGNNTVVVFLSDGQPYTTEGVTPTSGELYGTTSADAIREQGVPIYGVLHSPGAAHDAALAAMKAVCGENTVYESTDTESFGKAMNSAFSAVYGTHTVTIQVNGDFENVRGLTVSTSAGEAVCNEDGTITWTITGMPFTRHILTYSMSLTGENTERTGEIDYNVNKGNVVCKDSNGRDTVIGEVLLPRHLYTVTYLNGIDNSVLQATKVLAGRAIPAYDETETLTRAGYNFNGWAVTVGSIEDDVVTGDITLVAQWAAIPGPAPAAVVPAPVPDPDPVPPAPVPVPVVPAPAAPVVPAAPAAPAEEELPEPEVPQAGPEAPAEEIGEEETPLAGPRNAAWALINLILMVCTVLASILLLIGFMGKKEKELKDDNGNTVLDAEGNPVYEWTKKRHGGVRVFSLVPAVVALIAFILTENMRLPMILVDRWTLLMALIALVQLVVCLFAKKEKEEADEDQNAARA